jgi:hypothetical protein
MPPQHILARFISTASNVTGLLHQGRWDTAWVAVALADQAVSAPRLGFQQELQRLAAEGAAAADRSRAEGEATANSESALADLRGRL